MILVVFFNGNVVSSRIMKYSCEEYMRINAISGDVKISKKSTGKPYVLGKSMYISLSHTDNFTVCAVSDKEVGIDVEKIREIEFAKLSKRLFKKDMQKEMFFYHWCMAEAQAKYLDISIFESIKLGESPNTRRIKLFADYMMVLNGEGDIYVNEW